MVYSVPKKVKIHGPGWPRVAAVACSPSWAKPVSGTAARARISESRMIDLIFMFPPHRTMPRPPPGVDCDGRSVPWTWEWHWVHLVVKATFKPCSPTGFSHSEPPTSHSSFGAEETGVEVELVALQAEHGLVGRQQVVGDRAVRRVAQAAVLDHRLVLEDERAFLALVAGVAEVVEPHVWC